MSRGVADDDRRRVTEILWAAFSQKFERILRSAEEAAVVLGAGINPEGITLARIGARIVGVMGVKDSALEAFDGRVRDYVRVYGLIGGLWRLAAMLITDERAPRGALLVDAIGVAPEARGRGIGTVLLAEAEAIARERGHASLALSVVAENVDAVRLYERIGFRLVETKRVGWPIRRLVRFDAYHRMVKPL